jgi:hypothetical protein
MSQAFILPTQILGAERVLRQPSAYPTIEETETGGILVQAGPGTLNIAIDSPAYQGSHVLDPAALSQGPANLVAPTIAGTAEVGQVLTAKPGLWGHDGTLAAPVLAWQWLRNGAEIAGATGLEYTTTAADSGNAISLAETAQDAHGTARTVSVPLAMPTLLAPTQRAKANGSTAARVFAGLDLGAPAATRDIVVLAAVLGSAGATITGVKVAGVTATRLAQTLSGGSALACAGAWLARVPAGTAGSVELLTSANTTVQHVALFRGEGLRLADSTTVAVANGGSAAMTIQAGRAGGKELAFAVHNNGTASDWTGGSEIYDEDIQTKKFVSAAFGDTGPDGRASLSANRILGTGQIAGLMIAF